MRATDHGILATDHAIIQFLFLSFFLLPFSFTGLENSCPNSTPSDRSHSRLINGRVAGIEPGDERLSFVADGRITIVRQEPGSAWGCLAHLEGDPKVSDEASRQDAIEKKRDRTP